MHRHVTPSFLLLLPEPFFARVPMRARACVRIRGADNGNTNMNMQEKVVMKKKKPNDRHTYVDTMQDYHHQFIIPCVV